MSKWITKKVYEPLPWDTGPLSYDEYDEKTHSEIIERYFCPKCGYDTRSEIEPDFNFCPNCGENMRERDK